MSRPSRLLVLVLAAAVALAAAVSTTASTRSAAPLRVTVDIRPAGLDEVAQPTNLAARAGGETTIVFHNYTHAFHTFTIPALGISVLIRPAHGVVMQSTSVTFIAPYGTYVWHCVLCDSTTHPHMHAMRGKLYAIVNA